MSGTEIEKLPQLLRAAKVRELLGFPSESSWQAIKELNPEMVHVVPGMKRARYRKDVVVQKLLGRAVA